MLKLIRAGLIALAVLNLAAAECAPAVRAVLDNGLTVLAVPDDHSRIAGIAIVIGSSMADEPEDMRGARAVVQQLIVIDSHEQMGEQLVPVSAFIDPRSSGLGVNTDWDFVEVTLSVHAEELGIGLAALAKHVFSVEIAQERLDRTLELVRRGYDMAHQSPVQGTFDLFRAALYGDHPMSDSPQGRPEALQAMTLESLQAFRDAQYVPANAVLCVVAPMSADEIMAAAAEAFGGLPSAPAPQTPPAPEPPGDSRVEVGESAGLVQASMVVGVPLPAVDDPLFPAGEVIAALLDGRGGRLRRDLGLLQALALAIPTRLLDEHYPVGMLPVPLAERPFLAVHALSSPNTIESVRRGLLRHLLALRTGSVTDAEFDRARQRVINAHMLRHERPVDSALYLARRGLFGLGGADEAVAAVEAITKDDLTAVATQCFGRHAVGVQMPAS